VTRTEVRIDRLNIRSRGITPTVARAAVQNLGAEILQGLSQQRQNLPTAFPIQLDALNLGTVRTPQPQTPQQMRTAIARSVVHAIATHANSTGGQ
jgi:hypothetical protein